MYGFQAIGVTEMASMLQQHALSNEGTEGDQMLPPHPDQTDTIDGEWDNYPCKATLDLSRPKTYLILKSQFCVYAEC